MRSCPNLSEFVWIEKDVISGRRMKRCKSDIEVNNGFASSYADKVVEKSG
jgi:hypothetical protein